MTCRMSKWGEWNHTIKARRIFKIVLRNCYIVHDCPYLKDSAIMIKFCLDICTSDYRFPNECWCGLVYTKTQTGTCLWIKATIGVVQVEWTRFSGAVMWLWKKDGCTIAFQKRPKTKQLIFIDYPKKLGEISIANTTQHYRTHWSS